MNSSLLSVNEATFTIMAHGDLEEFRGLAVEYFEDTRQRMTLWPNLLEARDFTQLKFEFHRVKGGAAIFGFERLLAWLRAGEEIEPSDDAEVSLAEFEEELAAAENVVTAMNC